MSFHTSADPTDPNGVRGRRVTVMGLGTRAGGVGAARHLAKAGAIVTVSDARSAEALAAPIADLAGLPITFNVGGHDERDFTTADIVVRNPGVRRDHPLLDLARRHGVRIEMELSLFLRACPAPVVGITGTKGKTTVATLTGDLLRRWDARTIVAGNMGISALDHLPDISPTTPVVLEISSWQLESAIEHGLSPHIGVITVIAEDHLNTYRDFADYAGVKRGVVAHQHAADFAVLNPGDPEIWGAAAMTPASIVPYGAPRGGEGAWVEDGLIRWRWRGDDWSLPPPANPALAGNHQTTNILAALAAARLRGATREAIVAGLDGFAGIRDRMEPVATVNGVRFINDTTATAPIAAAAAINSLPGATIHLLAGGADKGLDPGPLAAAIGPRVSVYLFDGSGTPALAAALAARGVEPVGVYGSMTAIVEAALASAGPGAVILLSPGCASFGIFRDEFDRGEQFRRLALGLAAGEAPR
ncbi:MAG: UDP-N-acetylmuramoyl-L-alanine--D-glutamate ligase [Chloroflexota bacterium]